jgi:hypothetical protein
MMLIKKLIHADKPKNNIWNTARHNRNQKGKSKTLPQRAQERAENAEGT